MYTRLITYNKKQFCAMHKNSSRFGGQVGENEKSLVSHRARRVRRESG